jgi:putative DNA primase/helicase
MIGDKSALGAAIAQASASEQIAATIARLEEINRAALLNAALAYAASGWPVFPCNPTQDPPGTPAAKKRGKKPLVAGADKDEYGKAVPKTGGLWRASTDEAQIRAWWGKYPKALIGVPTGVRIGAFVVDLDPRDGECVDDVRARLVEAVGPLPDTPISVTQSGGWHLWFKNPSDGALPKNNAGRIPGVDWRGEGGYVIVPPSTMSDGKAYSWLVPPA